MRRASQQHQHTASPTSLEVLFPKLPKVSSNITDTIACILHGIVEQNQDVLATPRMNAPHAVFATAWQYDWANILDYINRLKEWVVCGAESFVVAICLLKRLDTLGALPPLTQRSVHRVFLTTFVLAVKFMEDEILTNADFAKVGCVTATQLARMELHALKALNFSCCVSPCEFEECHNELMVAQSFLDQQNFKPFARNGAAPLSILQVSHELRPTPVTPNPRTLVRRTSLFAKLRSAATKPTGHTNPHPPTTQAVQPTATGGSTPKPTQSQQHPHVQANAAASSTRVPIAVQRSRSVNVLAKTHSRPVVLFSNRREPTAVGSSFVLPANRRTNAAAVAKPPPAVPNKLARQDSI